MLVFLLFSGYLCTIILIFFRTEKLVYDTSHVANSVSQGRDNAANLKLTTSFCPNAAGWFHEAASLNTQCGRMVPRGRIRDIQCGQMVPRGRIPESTMRPDGPTWPHCKTTEENPS